MVSIAKKYKLAAAAAAVTIPLVTAASILAQGVASADDHKVATVQTAPKYGDDAVVGLLLYGSGQVATDHPNVAARFKPKDASIPVPTAAQVHAMTEQLLKVDPNFHNNVTLGVQRHDPNSAKAALGELGGDVKVLADQNNQSRLGSRNASPNGFFFTSANVAVEINAVGGINAVVYANAGLATEVAAVLYVVPDAISYGFDLNRGSQLDEEVTAAGLASSI